MSVAQVGVSGSITYQTFYDELSPYGTWIDYPGYGHVWNPHMDGDFRPYATNGYWNYSNEGWVWMSNYSWGWAPFHYGRWLYDDMYGWLWVPGYNWSPAWVTWGYVDNYYCWAPLMPEVNIRVQFGGWRPHDFYWNVCARDHIYDRRLVLQHPSVVNNISNRVTIINNYNITHVHNEYYAKGPAVNEVERYTNRKIEPVSMKQVRNIERMEQKGNQMRVFSPQVQHPQPAAVSQSPAGQPQQVQRQAQLPHPARQEPVRQPPVRNEAPRPQAVMQPHPREFRQMPESSPARPVRMNDKWPSMERSMQRSNIERLPVHRDNGGSPHQGGRMQGRNNRGR